MERWIISFFVGAILSFFSPVVPALFYKTFILLTVLMFFYVKRYRIALSFLCGILWILYQGYQVQQSWHINNINDNSIYQRQIETIISVDSIVDLQYLNRTEEVARFYAKVLSVNDKVLENPVKVRLSWKNAPLLKQGNRAKLTVKLKPSRHLANIGSFNYKTWLLTKNVIANGYVKEDPKNTIFSDQQSLRQTLYDQYRLRLNDHFLSPLMLALSFGERQLFTDTHWDVLKKTGTQHLMAISGLHIGLVFALSLVTIRCFFNLLPITFLNNNLTQALMRQNVQPFALLICFFIAFAYAYLANMSIPTMRALIMLSVLIIAKIVKVHLSINRLILFCLFAILIIEPLSLLSVSFWLSFIAVLIIIFCMWRFHYLTLKKNKFHRYVFSLIILQLGLVGLMLPLNAMIFNEISALAIVANLITVPFVSLVLLPIILLSLVSLMIGLPLTQFLVDLALTLFSFLWDFLTYLSSFSLASIELSIAQQFYVGLISLLVFALLIKPIQLNIYQVLRLAIPIVFILNLTAFMTFKNEEWRLVVFDVGQGLSIAVIQAQRAIVYDTGAKYPTGFNMVEAVVIPYLKSQHIEKLDYVFISHDDNDHAGGLQNLLAEIDTEVLIANQVYREVNSEPDFKAPYLLQPCLAGQVWQWQSLLITALHPNELVGEKNDDSCVLHISDGKHSALLSGDISRKVERQIISKLRYGQVDVVVAPHHGSKTSSSKAFIKWAKPKYSVFSTGFMNRWNMPNAEVLSRYRQANVKTFNTADSGMVQFTFNQESIEILEYRTDITPYWFAN